MSKHLELFIKDLDHNNKIQARKVSVNNKYKQDRTKNYIINKRSEIISKLFHIEDSSFQCAIPFKI